MATSTITKQRTFKAPTWEYVGDVGSTIFSGTWTCPDDGMIVLMGGANNSASQGYWYVDDSTDNHGVARLYWDRANQTGRSSSFPVIKGHNYTSQKAAMASANAYYYKLVAGEAQ